MTEKEAKENQERIAKHYDLRWWYGVKCRKCCGVYPKIMFEGNPASEDCYYQCEVCGRRTKGFTMPHLAVEAWNAGDVDPGQMSLF